MCRYFAILAIAIGAVAGCASDEDPAASGGITAGKYIGSVTIEGSTPFVKGNSKFTVDAAGNITGTVTIAAGEPNAGDVGTITGTSKAGATLGLLELELSYDSAVMGKYTAKGSEPYSPAIKQLAFSPSARNTANVIVGRFFFLGEPE